jgi:hypothetical protein
MAAQVLHGSGNVTYTNSTGQNVRVVINYLSIRTGGVNSINITANGSTWSQQLAGSATYGKTIGYRIDGTNVGQNVYTSSSSPTSEGCPLEFALDNGGTFSINSTTTPSFNQYNIIIIPEAG